MASRPIKISDENYKWLLEVAADMQKKLGKLVSFNEALNEIRKKVKDKK